MKLSFSALMKKTRSVQHSGIRRFFFFLLGVFLLFTTSSLLPVHQGVAQQYMMAPPMVAPAPPQVDYSQQQAQDQQRTQDLQRAQDQQRVQDQQRAQDQQRQADETRRQLDIAARAEADRQIKATADAAYKMQAEAEIKARAEALLQSQQADAKARADAEARRDAAAREEARARELLEQGRAREKLDADARFANEQRAQAAHRENEERARLERDNAVRTMYDNMAKQSDEARLQAERDRIERDRLVLQERLSLKRRDDQWQAKVDDDRRAESNRQQDQRDRDDRYYRALRARQADQRHDDDWWQRRKAAESNRQPLNPPSYSPPSIIAPPPRPLRETCFFAARESRDYYATAPAVEETGEDPDSTEGPQSSSINRGQSFLTSTAASDKGVVPAECRFPGKDQVKPYGEAKKAAIKENAATLEKLSLGLKKAGNAKIIIPGSGGKVYDDWASPLVPPKEPPNGDIVKNLYQKSNEYRVRKEAQLIELGLPVPRAPFQFHHRVPMYYADPDRSDAMGDVNEVKFDYHSPDNIRILVNSAHQLITNEWIKFQLNNPEPTWQQVNDFADQLDDRHSENYLYYPYLYK